MLADLATVKCKLPFMLDLTMTLNPDPDLNIIFQLKTG